ncbi:MAG: hypothetical protein Q9218_005072 [Villophora microphyllina]
MQLKPWLMLKHRIPQSKLVERLTVQFSDLSLGVRNSASWPTWSRLELLPPEIVAIITGNLVFFDKKALSSTSHRVYGLMGPLHPPDRFAWRLHVCTSFNRAPADFFDVTIFEADQIRRELRRMVRQLSDDVRWGHYKFDPEKTRMKDLSCLYFPGGTQMDFRGETMEFNTLGQFIALQFNDYIRRVIHTARKGGFWALDERFMRPSTDCTDERKRLLEKEAGKWKEIHDTWLQGMSIPKARLTSWLNPLPPSAWEESVALLRKMGYRAVYRRDEVNGGLIEFMRRPITVYDKKSELESLNHRLENMDRDDESEGSTVEDDTMLRNYAYEKLDDTDEREAVEDDSGDTDEHDDADEKIDDTHELDDGKEELVETDEGEGIDDGERGDDDEESESDDKDMEA